MKISNQQVQRMLQAYEAEKTQKASTRAEQRLIPSEPSDKVAFSGLARLLAQLRQEAGQPFVRQEKVDEIKRLLEEKNYIIDTQAIAGQMIKRSLLDRLVMEEGNERA